MGFLEIKHLRMVRSIAETGNLTKAAQKLSLSQSALSQQLKDIENKLAVDLFFRTRKKMILTPTGEKLLRTADNVVELLDDTELEILKRAKGERGELKVGTQCIFCFKWLPRIMENFQKEFPNIEFEIGTSYDPAAELLRKRFDIIITVLSVGDETYTNVPLFRDELVCILARDHPLNTRKHIGLEDFRELSVISHSEKAESRFYRFVLRPREIEPRRFMTVVQPQAIMELVASGFGVGVFPLWAVNGMLAATNKVVTLPISEDGFPLTWNAMFLKNSNMPPFQKEFINMIRNMDRHSVDGFGPEDNRRLLDLPFPPGE